MHVVVVGELLMVFDAGCDVFVGDGHDLGPVDEEMEVGAVTESLRNDSSGRVDFGDGVWVHDNVGFEVDLVGVGEKSLVGDRFQRWVAYDEREGCDGDVKSGDFFVVEALG